MTNAPTDYVNLPACSKRKVMEVDDFSTANASNRTLATQLVKEQLNSLDLIECVIKMADTAVVDDVKVFLEMMVNKSPELVFMGLLQIDPLANKVHEDLFARLIVYYFTGNASSVFVFTKFWKAKPELFKKNILELYNNDPTALTRILAFVHELKILPAILDLQPFLFTIDLAALAARREYLNLEKWLQDKIKENGDVFCKACLAFLGSKIRAELTRQETQSAPITVPLSMDVVNVFIKVLAESNIDTNEKEILRDIQAGYLKINQKVSPNVGVLVTSWLTHADDERKYNVPVTVALIKANLINLPEQDQELATLIDSGRMSAIDFTARLIRACLYEEGGLATRQDFMASLEALSRLRGNVPESVLFLMEEMRRRSVPGGTATPVTLQQHPMLPQGLSDEEIAIREQMHVLFSEWIRLYQHPTSTDKILKVFVTQLSQQNIFKMEDMSSLFYRTCIEASVEHAIKHKQLLNQPVGLTYLPIDALSKLIVCLMELPQPPVDNSAIGKAAMDSPDSARIALFTKILSIVILVISQMHDQRQQQFDQRPFLRFFTSLLCELHSSEQQLQTVYMSILSALSNTFNTLQPLNFPGFTFAWLQLTSHRMFMPKLLLAENQKGWPIFQQLLISLFKFLNPFLHKAKLKDTTRMLYRGTLRVLLVLLHDFPEFLCDYHYSLCDVIPSSCIQLRNLILSAFPRHMRLPDPFTPNLKVDLLPDINQSPNILSDYTSILKKNNLKQEIDDYMKSQIDKAKFLASLPSKLMLAKDEQEDSKYNVSMMNALVFYVGVTGVTEGIPVNQGAPIQIFQYLLNELDSEGRYLFLSATANQLRYPNSHTHYFSCVILYLFAESTKEIVKEQITRVLLERLIIQFLESLIYTMRYRY
ncbi:hypothetical protein RMATCC62417_12166 [Rhizopus microsporus]|nr:hypothetical protein RMATCC62417_12166 [Rhizopus microsporus]